MCSIYESFDYIDEISIDKEKFISIKTSIDGLLKEKEYISHPTACLPHNIQPSL